MSPWPSAEGPSFAFTPESGCGLCPRNSRPFRWSHITSRKSRRGGVSQLSLPGVRSDRGEGHATAWLGVPRTSSSWVWGRQANNFGFVRVQPKAGKRDNGPRLSRVSRECHKLLSVNTHRTFFAFHCYLWVLPKHRLCLRPHW